MKVCSKQKGTLCVTQLCVQCRLKVIPCRTSLLWGAKQSLLTTCLPECVCLTHIMTCLPASLSLCLYNYLYLFTPDSDTLWLLPAPICVHAKSCISLLFFVWVLVCDSSHCHHAFFSFLSCCLVILAYLSPFFCVTVYTSVP